MWASGLDCARPGKGAEDACNSGAPGSAPASLCTRRGLPAQRTQGITFPKSLFHSGFWDKAAYRLYPFIRSCSQRTQVQAGGCFSLM